MNAQIRYLKNATLMKISEVAVYEKNICGSGYPTYPKFLLPTLNFFLQILMLEESSRTK